MALWTPARITTVLWLDASDASTLYNATSGGSLVAANGTIARWQDKSGNARHVTQATSGSRPLRKTSIVNSLDIARFDGTDDLLETAFASFGTAYCVMSVVMSTNPTASGGIIVCRSKTAGLPLNPQSAFNGSGNMGWAVRNDAGTLSQNVISGLSASVYYLAGGTRSGNNVTTYLDGTAGTTGTNNVSGVTTTTVTSVGALYSGTGTPNTFLNGDIGEIIVCSDIAEREKIEGYLAHKWGQSSRLPSGHPYKNAAPSYGGSSPINGQSLVRPAGDYLPQQLIVS